MKLEIFNINGGLVNNHVNVITSDNNGNLWFSAIMGVSVFNGKSWLSFTETDGLVGNIVSDIKVGNLNNIWIATNKGVTKLSGIISHSYSIEEFLPKDDKLKLDAYPNPFNSSVNIVLTLDSFSIILVKIFDITGALIKNIESNMN